MTRGNNPYGSVGTIKCKPCRDRRKKVIIYGLCWSLILGNSASMIPGILQPLAVSVIQQGLSTCIKEPAPLQQQRENQYQQSSEGSQTASNSRVSEVAQQYERAYPNATPQEILAYVTAAIARRRGSWRSSISATAGRSNVAADMATANAVRNSTNSGLFTMAATADSTGSCQSLLPEYCRCFLQFRLFNYD